MATVAEMMVKIGADIKDLESKINTASDKLDGLADSKSLAFAGTLAAGIAVVGTAMVAAGGYAVNLAGQMEQTRTAFTTLTGSAESADKVIREMVKFGAKTPFEQKGLLDSTKRLMAFGMNSDKAATTVKTLADAVAATGGGTAELEGVATAVGQIQAKGKLSAEELNQLTERGIPGLQMVAQGMGMTMGEVSAQMQRGAISSDQAIAALMAGINSKFKGAAESQSNTFLGQLSNLKDNVNIIMTGIGGAIIDAFNLTEALGWINNLLGTFQDVYEQTGSLKAALDSVIPPGLQIAIIAVAGAIMGLLIGALVAAAPAIWAAVTAFGALLLSMLPFILIGAAVAAAAYLIIRYWDQIVAFFTTTVPAAINATIEWFRTLPERISEFISTLPERIAYWIGFAIGTMIRLVHEGNMKVIQFFRELPGKIVAFLIQLHQKGVDVMVRFVKGIIKTANELPGFFSDLIDKILKFMVDLPGKIMDKAVKVGSAIWDGFKKGLGISSPSYVERALMAIEERARLTMQNMGKLAPRIQTSMEVIGKPAMDLTRSITAAPTASPTNTMAMAPAPIYVNQMVVREDADLDRIATRLYRMQQTRSRGRTGVNI